MAIERELGKITKVDLFIEDHGILTLFVSFDYGGGGQGFGGFALDTFSKEDGRRVGTAGGLDFILRLLQLFQVDRLSQIVGRVVYALRDGGMIVGIEQLPFDGGGCFMVDEWRQRWFPKEAKR